MGIVVNAGGNATGHYIGGENWHIPGAPFVGGIGGFASVFVTASFACEYRSISCRRVWTKAGALTYLRRWH
jgi:amino acid permease